MYIQGLAQTRLSRICVFHVLTSLVLNMKLLMNVVAISLAAMVNAVEVPVRLTNGGTHGHYEGRVEVYYNGQWGTVCDDNWDIVDANVVCQQLGFGGAIRTHYFGSGNSSMPIWLDEVQCTTRDSNLSECGHAGWGNNDCIHFEDAGVTCTGTGCTEGYLRLAGSANIYEGRIEVCHDDEWGTVCDDSWSTDDGIVACRQLGFPYVRVNTTATFGQGTGQIWLDNLLCTGFENHLFDCNHNGFGSHDCFHSEDAGLVCDAPIRLVNGGTQFEGRVEVYYNGQWGTVCDDNWDIVAANVVCQQLGFGDAVRVYTSSHFGSGSSSMPIWLDDVQCTTRDRYLSECGHNGWGNNNCNHFEDAGVACTGTIRTACTEGRIRLVGGSSIYEGRVEVCHNGEWGTVCDDSWSISDGIVACHQLGYSFVRVTTSAFFGQGTGAIWLDNLSCRGSETRLIDCNHNGFGIHDCFHSEDAGLVCDYFSNYDYYYDDDDDSTGSRLSAGAIAGITIGGVFLFFFISTSLIVAIIYLRRHHVKQQKHSCNITQLPDQRTLVTTAPAPPSALPCAYNPTLYPTVLYNSPTDGCVTVATPHQFSGSPQPAGPQPEYFPEPQPAEYVPGLQPAYIPEPQLEYIPGPQPEYIPGQQPGYVPGPQPEYIPEPQPGALPGYAPDPQSGFVSEPPPDYNTLN
ncbi:scavenger receptor cysteine-rich domain-containing group B protein-like isoform X2 [Dysidea avara]|uniref:scavenger receptor cysteine-rich domain-containing group B protein-like isoform X2 n=1 Tax=Dysidea avara TaxID=196820 RepID=UPI003327900A